MKSSSLLTLAILMAACEEDEEKDKTTGISVGDEAEIIPRLGQWYYDVWEWTAHECGVTDDDLPINSEDGFKIPASNRDRFDLSLDSDIELSCSLSGEEFLCGEISTTSSYNDGTVELQIELRTEGHFRQESFMIGHHQIELDCYGDGCGAVEAWFGMDFPCSAGIDFNAFHA